MFVWGTKGSFELVRVRFFFFCVEKLVCMPNEKLHIFKAFKIVVFFFHLVNIFTAFVKLFWVDALYKSVSK